MQAYSLDFRQKIVSAYENGFESIVEVAGRFDVSPSFIKKMLAQYRLTGSIAPIGHCGGQPRKLSDKHRKWILRTVLGEPDITLADLQERLQVKKKISVSVPTLSRELRRLNLRRKKNRYVRVNETQGNEPGTGDD